MRSGLAKLSGALAAAAVAALALLALLGASRRSTLFARPKPTQPTLYAFLGGVFRFTNGSVDCLDKERSYARDEAQTAVFVKAMDTFARTMNSTGLPVSMGFGSLLGWRRECGVVKHTTDVDFMADGSAVTQAWLTGAAHLPSVKLEEIIGSIKSKTLEVSFSIDGLKVDLFFAFPDGKGAFFIPGRAVRWEYALALPISMCSTRLQDVVLWAPCAPDAILELQYGADWASPVVEWVWDQSPNNIRHITKAPQMPL